MNLPGLNFNPYDYPELTDRITDGDYRMIPFSDWLPPYFEDVYCCRGFGLKLMYFSPSTGMMVPAESEVAGEAMKPDDLDYWLKRVA